MTKQAVINEIFALLQRPAPQVARGSTEPTAVFTGVSDALNLNVDPNLPKPEAGKAIAALAGLPWGADCDSTSTPSGGGSTVTLVGLRRLLEATEILTAQMGQTVAGTPLLFGINDVLMEYETDARKALDAERLTAMRVGITHAQSRTYAQKTLRRLTWMNLGYRLAKLTKSSPKQAEAALAALKTKEPEAAEAARSALDEPVSQQATWIFQGNPDVFDIDGYLAADFERITWSVKQRATDIKPGDVVYLWRAAGKSKQTAGIVAKAIVTSEPRLGLDDPNAVPFWLDDKGHGEAVRAWLRVERVANEKQVIRRSWLAEDPICADLPILKMPNRTNFEVTPAQSRRLNSLWERTGVDWNRAECVAALWVFNETSDGELSKAVGSLVAGVALQVGRAVGAVYNKVLNFRALDPRDERAGLPAGGQTTKAVWSEFFDAEEATLRAGYLGNEYVELWGADHERTPSVQSTDPLGPPPTGGENPGRGTSTVERVIRRTKVTEWVKKAHDFTCQACGTRLEGLKGPFAEGAHVKPLGGSHKGRDEVANMLCLCPNHHALLDRGAFWIDDDLSLQAAGSSDLNLLPSLRDDPRHEVAPANLQYHRTEIARGAD